MDFASLDDLRARAGRLGAGPVLMVVAEGAAEIAGTLAHHRAKGMDTIVLALPPGVPAPEPLPEGVHPLHLPPSDDDPAPDAVTALIEGRPEGAWIAWCYDAEYLHTPFSEDRGIPEAMAFCAEERRDAIPTRLVDLYPADLSAHPSGIDPEAPLFDATGYYALGRWNEAEAAHHDRQIEVFGGLRRRFEEHVPWDRRRIDRVSIFRVRPGLRLLPDHRVTDEEMNTHQCPWHHSPTACLASFRAARALATNPASRGAVEGFTWSGSVRFEGGSRQLMDLGLMEPGQWF